MQPANVADLTFIQFLYPAEFFVWPFAHNPDQSSLVELTSFHSLTLEIIEALMLRHYVIATPVKEQPSGSLILKLSDSVNAR